MFKIGTKTPLTRSILKPYLDLLGVNPSKEEVPSSEGEIPISFTFETVAGEKFRGLIQEIKITKTNGKVVGNKQIESPKDLILSFSIVGVDLSRVNSTGNLIGDKTAKCSLSFENPTLLGETEESKPAPCYVLKLECGHEPVTITRPKPK